MKSITSSLRKRFADKNMAQLSIGAFCIELVKPFAKDPKNIHGYLRFHKLFLLLSSKEDPTKWFLEKNKILVKINKKLKDFGYDYRVQDIRIK